METFVEQAAAVGLDALAVVDHGRIEASLAPVDLCAEPDVLGIPGMEVGTVAGNVLERATEAVVGTEVELQAERNARRAR